MGKCSPSFPSFYSFFFNSLSSWLVSIKTPSCFSSFYLLLSFFFFSRVISFFVSSLKKKKKSLRITKINPLSSLKDFALSSAKPIWEKNKTKNKPAIPIRCLLKGMWLISSILYGSQLSHSYFAFSKLLRLVAWIGNPAPTAWLP